MSIHISSDGRRFQLDTLDTSYQFSADKYGTLIHNYYGRRIPFEDLSDGVFFADVGFSGNPWDAGEERTYSPDTLPQEYSGYANGDYRESSVVLTFLTAAAPRTSAMNPMRYWTGRGGFPTCPRCGIRLRSRRRRWW